MFEWRNIHDDIEKNMIDRFCDYFNFTADLLRYQFSSDQLNMSVYPQYKEAQCDNTHLSCKHIAIKHVISIDTKISLCRFITLGFKRKRSSGSIFVNKFKLKNASVKWNEHELFKVRILRYTIYELFSISSAESFRFAL